MHPPSAAYASSQSTLLYFIIFSIACLQVSRMKDNIPVRSNTSKMHANRPSESRRPVVAISLAEFISLLSNRQHKVLGNLRAHADKTLALNKRVYLLPRTHRGKREPFADTSFQDQHSSRSYTLPPCQPRHVHVRARELGCRFQIPPLPFSFFFSSSSGPLAPRPQIKSRRRSCLHFRWVWD